MQFIKDLEYIQDYIGVCRPDALVQIKAIIEKEIPHFHEPENFYLHNATDEYFYVITFKNGEKYTEIIGQNAYLKYVNDENAVKIERKTKNLFPTFELLAEKH